jgi:hypothetical protein
MNNHRKLRDFHEQMKGELTREDCLLICGDFGAIWDGGESDNFMIHFVYEKFPCTVLWVDGNHENFDALDEYPVEKWMGGKVHRISENVLHLMRGEIFLLTVGKRKVKILAFGGAKSTDRGYDTGIMRGWWPQELPNQEEYDNALRNLAIHDHAIDYIFTHDAPSFVLYPMFGFTRHSDEVFKEFLGRIAMGVDYRAWYFGHHHRDISYDKFHCLFKTIVEIRGDV